MDRAGGGREGKKMTSVAVESRKRPIAWT